MAATKLAEQAGTVTVGDMVVNRIGLGTNRISDTAEAKELLHRAVEVGVNFIDTAHRYGGGASETTIGATLAPYPKGLVIATKGGFHSDGPAGSPEELKADLADSLGRLKVDQIDLYQLHRVDPKVPLKDSIGTLKQFQKEGKIRHIGLSEVSVGQLEEARSVATIVSVQNLYNVIEREYEDLVDYCTREGIVFIPWFPLGGLAGGAQKVNDLLATLAQKYQASPQQLSLAWLLKRSPMMLPIPGTLSVDHLESNLKAGEIALSDEDFEEMSLIGRR